MQHLETHMNLINYSLKEQIHQQVAKEHPLCLALNEGWVEKNIHLGLCPQLWVHTFLKMRDSFHYSTMYFRPSIHKHNRIFGYSEWEDSCSDKEGKTIKSIHVSLINSGIAELANDKDMAFLGPSPKKVDHEERKMTVFFSQCLSGLLSVLNRDWLDLPP